MMHRCWIIALLLLAPLAQAATVSAFLDRSQVSLGDTVTLNIKSDGAIGTPDLAPLQKDFQVLGSSRSSSVAIVNGKTTRSDQLGIALKPLHAGTLTIPALSVGGTRTQPLTLRVGAAPAGGSGKLGDPAFMQASVLASAPYVGEQTVYTVRLYYLPGVSGSLGDPSADGARLVKLDRDHSYMTQRDGYAYKVLERSWALIPTRSGPITVQGPAFQGQGAGAGNLGALLNNPGALLNNPNALLNGQLPGLGTAVTATAPAVSIDARAEPAHGGKPWLPARGVQLRLTGLPANGGATAGVPVTVTLSISASGQPADALPEPELPTLAGARVYPDQTQDTTDATGEWLRGTRTRSFAIVPDRDGTLSIPALTLNWFNVTTGQAEQAAVPAHALRVTGAVATAAGSAAPPSAGVASGASAPVPASAAPPPPARAVATAVHWRDIALASLVLWLAVVLAAGVWWWRRRLSARAPAGAVAAGADAHPANLGVASVSSSMPRPPAKPDSRALHASALAAARAGDASACERALLAWARGVRPACVNLGALRAALSDAGQREALRALQRARWERGDPASACASVALAFARGFVWRDPEPHARQDTGALPPLYPPAH
ncbi:MAG: protein BatD [Rhodanobacteraceae bacterium]|nr:MAG: protein BatD [Rhodanobacteraceae bacterium]